MLPHAYSELKLLTQIVDGDASAFRIIYERYQGKVFLFALRLTKSKSEAEEIVQEVFVKLWERRSGINIEKNFNAYILTITRNLVIDILKKAARDKTVQEKTYENMLKMQSASVDLLIHKETERLHRLAIENLSPKRKVVYMLSREEELTYEEIANKLNISRNTVRNQMTESIKSIREFLTVHLEVSCITLVALHSSFLKIFLAG